MRKVGWWWLFFFLLLVLMPVLPAQGAEQAIVEEPLYTVQSGDTLWELSGLHKGDPRQWRAIVDANPFLKEPGRIFERGGKIIALIRPDEKLAGLEQLGVLPKPLSLEQLRPAPSQAAAPSASGSTKPRWLDYILLLFLLATLIMLVAVAVLTWRERQRRRAVLSDPTTAGPPFVAPNVPRTPELVAREFERIASTAVAQQYPNAPTPVRLQRVGSIERGFVSGTGRVYYADGSNREMRLERTEAFRALYELPGGEREFLYSLAGCMNPVTYSGEYLRGFDWEPAAEAERVIVPAPEVRPERPTEPASVVSPHVVAAAEEAPEPTLTTVTVDGIELRVPRGFSMTYDGNGIVLAATGPGEVTVRLAARKTRRPRAVAK